ncbi:MAG: hypothetical protein ACJAQ2_002138, partial [Vicingaceae bacterium]
PALLFSGAAINAVATKASSVSIGFNSLLTLIDVCIVVFSIVEDFCIVVFVGSGEVQEINIPVKMKGIRIRFICFRFIVTAYQ